MITLKRLCETHCGIRLVSEPGGIALRNKRHERFADLLASPAPPTLLDAWRQSASAVGKSVPDPSNSARVGASKAHSRQDVSNRIAFLREQRIKNRQKTDSFSERLVYELLTECTDALVAASIAAERAGVGATQAASMRAKVVTHAGRMARANRFIEPEPTPEAEVKLPALCWCNCGTSQ